MTALCKNTEYATTRRLLVTEPFNQLPGDAVAVKGGLRFLGFEKAGAAGKPLFSIIMAVFNSSAVLEHAIRSVIYQDYDNVELIIIDGGSTDGSVELIRKYNECIDYWVSEPDDGIYYALNKGIEAAKGDWLYFLGSDDVMLNCLHQLAGRFVDPNGVYYGDVYYPAQHKLFGGEFSAYRVMNCQIPHQATFYPKRLFLRYKFDTRYISASDYAFNIVCYNDKDFTYRYLPVLVAVYEDTSGFSTQDLDKRFHREKNDLLQKNFSRWDCRKYAIRTFIKGFDRYFARKIFKLFKKRDV